MNHVYFQRTATWLVAFFFLVSGISIGAFTELSLPADNRAQVGSYLMEHLFTDGPLPDHGAVLLQSAGNNLGLLLLIFLSGLTAVGLPAAYAAVTYKGAALGFSAALLLESLGLQGIMALFFSVLPPNLLLLPALFLAVSASVNFNLNRRGSRRKKSLSREARPYCACFLPPLILTAAAVLIEAFICPALLRLIK